MRSHAPHLRPYLPKKLPVTVALNRQLLDSTRQALADYDALLAKATCPKELFHMLALQETIATTQLSTQSMHLKDYLHILLQNNTTHPAANNISDTLQAFHTAVKMLNTSRFSKAILCKIHSMIKKHTATPKSALGQYRSKQNWIGPKGCTFAEAYFLPPTPKEVKSSMQQLVTYANRPSQEPLLQLTLTIAQILIIHPFMDGNGRAARMSIPLILYKSGALSSPYFFMSSYIQKHRLDYLQTLYDITDEENWLNWSEFFLKGLKRQAKQESKKVEKLLKRWNFVEEKLKEINTPLSRKRILQFLFTHPLFTAARLQETLKCSLLKRDRLISHLHNLKLIKPYRIKQLKGWSFQPFS